MKKSRSLDGSKLKIHETESDLHVVASKVLNRVDSTPTLNCEFTLTRMCVLGAWLSQIRGRNCAVPNTLLLPPN